jgi:DNA-directed RNA polymerase specialized sigma24 family protein
VAAAHATDVARAALEDLCQLYRPPMRGYIRSLGYSAHDADDLTQLFLLRLATGKLLHHVDPAKGRFRHFVRVCLKHFLRDEHDRKTARKRGGDVELVLLNEQSAAARLRVYRLRREYGAVLREELARTVNAPDEIEAELRYLLRVLTAGS